MKLDANKDFDHGVVTKRRASGHDGVITIHADRPR
jgi:hypothetical protein